MSKTRKVVPGISRTITVGNITFRKNHPENVTEEQYRYLMDLNMRSRRALLVEYVAPVPPPDTTRHIIKQSQQEAISNLFSSLPTDTEEVPVGELAEIEKGEEEEDAEGETPLPVAKPVRKSPPKKKPATAKKSTATKKPTTRTTAPKEGKDLVLKEPVARPTRSAKPKPPPVKKSLPPEDPLGPATENSEEEVQPVQATRGRSRPKTKGG